MSSPQTSTKILISFLAISFPSNSVFLSLHLQSTKQTCEGQPQQFNNSKDTRLMWKRLKCSKSLAIMMILCFFFYFLFFSFLFIMKWYPIIKPFFFLFSLYWYTHEINIFISHQLQIGYKSLPKSTQILEPNVLEIKDC